MKIGIIGPSPVPFMYGGAEKLMFDLCANINTITSHQAELIKIPVDEFSFWGLIEAYYKFYTLDLNQFDLVITSKYPSWMTRHDNSICWMMHTLRGLYDVYSERLGLDVDRKVDAVNHILDYIDQNDLPCDLDDFFSMLFQVKNENLIPSRYTGFPGPLIRKIIHYMDKYGLCNQRRLYSISDTVRARTDYFPNGATPKTIYPPIDVEVENQIFVGDYFFVCSRLDVPKRFETLISEYKKCKTNYKLLIAGSGPSLDSMKKIIGNDRRIELLGFVSDEEKDRLYANCIAVPYIPYDEDYGYITIEAMTHSKPVITLKDSGGPCEFVQNGTNGFVVEEKVLHEKIDFYATHKDIAVEHGKNACTRIKQISWRDAINRLLDDKDMDDKKKKKITVTSTFSIYPPLGGGQVRIYNLYKNVTDAFDVSVVASCGSGASKDIHEFNRCFREICIPRTIEHEMQNGVISGKVGLDVTDITMLSLSRLSPEYGKALEASMRDSDIIIASHPYMYNEIKKYIRSNQALVYEAHNVEYNMKSKMLNDSIEAKELLEQLLDAEKEVCNKSTFIMTCSEEDANTLHNLYGVKSEKIIVVPNGVDCMKTTYTSVNERLAKKSRLGMQEEKIGIFVGSYHMPNIDASMEIIKLAKNLPNVKFMLIGSQCTYFKNNQIEIPTNVGLMDVISDEEKNRVFSTVDFALNPMKSGSGTNLKMFDYMAAGIPVITTDFGARGIDDRSMLITAEIEEMAKVIEEFDLIQYDEMVAKGRGYIEKTFDWRVISKILKDRLNECYGDDV